jgi:3-hydroxybutyryl-CoA dehydrogenase
MTVQFEDIRTIGVVGAGFMGAGIAQVLATSGLEVVLADRDSQALGRAQSEISSRIERLSEKGLMLPDEASTSRERVTYVNDLDLMSNTQVVIEAIFERLDVKQSLFEELENIVSPDTILATNTSSISIASIYQRLRYSERACGMHFFSPVPLMKLVEIIPGPFTASPVIEMVRKLAGRMGKTPVLAKDGPGFLVNLGGRAYSTEALHIVAEKVADPAQVDRIMTGSFGFRMGPFELMDMTGVDTNLAVTTYVHEGYQFDPRIKTVPLQKQLVDSGRRGRKVSAGFYDYPRAQPARTPKPLAGQTRPLTATWLEPHPGFHLLAEHGLKLSAAGGEGPVLICPLGEDASTAVAKLSLDPTRVVAIDFSGVERRMLTLMTPPVTSKWLEQVAGWLRNAGFAVEIVNDSPGFVAQRILAMIINLCCEMAQTGVGSPKDIDIAMQLGLNYPCGPFALGETMGASQVWTILLNLQAITGSDRYRPSLWLRRRAQLGLSLRAEIQPP